MKKSCPLSSTGASRPVNAAEPFKAGNRICLGSTIQLDKSTPHNNDIVKKAICRLKEAPLTVETIRKD